MRRFTTSDRPPVTREGIYSDPAFRPPDGGTAVAASDPPAGVRHAVDEDLRQMTDDGCPPDSDAAPRTDPDWRDNLGEWDTFDDEVRMGFPGGSQQAVQPQQAPGHLSPATDRRAAPLVCPDCGKSFSPAVGDLSFVRPTPDGDGHQGPGQLTVACHHCGSLRPVYWGEKSRASG